MKGLGIANVTGSFRRISSAKKPDLGLLMFTRRHLFHVFSGVIRRRHGRFYAHWKTATCR
jgi:hypothetical protein